MEVKLFSTFREHAGVSSIHLNLHEQISVREVIGLVIDDYPGLKRVWLNSDGELHGHVHITLNQTDVMSLPMGMETLVKLTDELNFFPPISGG